MGVLADLRGRVVDVLSALDPDWSVHPTAVDAVSPPAFVLGWSDPWTEPSTFRVESARLEILLVAGRIDPDPGIETLETMVERSTSALGVAGFRLVTAAPGPIEIGGLRYLAARQTITYPVTFP